VVWPSHLLSWLEEIHWKLHWGHRFGFTCIQAESSTSRHFAKLCDFWHLTFGSCSKWTFLRCGPLSVGWLCNEAGLQNGAVLSNHMHLASSQSFCLVCADPLFFSLLASSLWDCLIMVSHEEHSNLIRYLDLWRWRYLLWHIHSNVRLPHCKGSSGI